MSASVQHVTVTLPGGEKRSVPAGSAPREILPHAAQAIAAKVNGKVVDLSRPVTVDCEIEPITPSSAEGLEALRHSSAHLLAQAVKRLFPDVQITMRPVIENGV